MNPTISELEETDRVQLSKQLFRVNSILKENFGDVALTGTNKDLLALQRILNSNLLNKSQTYELQSLGVALGEILCTELGLYWVIVRDEQGSHLALRYKNTSLIFYPATMISKRVEHGEKVDVAQLFQLTQSHLSQLKDEVG